jgi:hypothetical protein
MTQRRHVPRARWLMTASALSVFSCMVYELPSTGGGAGAGGGGASGKPTGGDAGMSSGAKSPVAGSANEGGSASEAGKSPTGGSAAGNQSTGGTSAGGAAGEPSSSGGEGGESSPPDACPDDPNKLQPGTCGCGVPDVATATVADCQSLVKKLTHRYDFEGSGSALEDRVGSADGVLRGATLSKLDGRGVALLGGGTSGAYVDLPNKLVSPLTAVTLECWVTWGGGGDWQRLFDFGDSTHATPENNPQYGKTFLFVTARSADGHVAAGYSLAGYENQLLVEGSAALSVSMNHVALTASTTGDAIKLYVDGVKAGEEAWTGTLSGLNDVNSWLGRSQFDSDAELSGVFHEFRIYNAALTDAEVVASFRGGPDPVFLQ